MSGTDAQLHASDRLLHTVDDRCNRHFRLRFAARSRMHHQIIRAQRDGDRRLTAASFFGLFV